MLRFALPVLLACLLPLSAEVISLPFAYSIDNDQDDPENTLLFITEPTLYKRRLLSYVITQIQSDAAGYPNIHKILVVLEEDAHEHYAEEFYRVVYLTSWNQEDSEYLISWNDQAVDAIDLLFYTKLNPYEEHTESLLLVDAISTASELSNIEKTASKIFSILAE